MATIPRTILIGWVLLICFSGRCTWSQDTLVRKNLTEKLQQESSQQLAADAARFGDPSRGAIAFHKPTMNCAKCHVAGTNGRRLGPNLAEQREIKIEHLVESILNPSAKIKEGFETAVIQHVDGRTLSGVFVEETGSELVIDQIEQPEKPLRTSLEDVDDWRKTTQSSMPEGLANQLGDRSEFLDLVSYLVEIAVGGEARAEALEPATTFTLAPLPEYESRVDHASLIGSFNRAAFLRGEETYRLRCASCHGTQTEEGSMPTSLRFAQGQFKRGSDPYSMYQTLTHGFGMMNAQRWMVPQQKYDVIHYIRETFLRENNPGQFFKLEPNYVASLPAGDTRGPKPVVNRPWTGMDYGHSLNNTIEVSQDGTNIAQKGIVIRLDEGPGGVESGRYWMMYEHDTLRVAAAWSGGFIDYNGIHFNGVHNRHPRVTGQVSFANPTGPGWGKPDDGSFVDARVIGRDKKHYGPLDRSWAHFQGLYRFGNQTILKYTVADAEILESPSLTFVDSQAIFVRRLEIGPRDKELTLQVANLPGTAIVQRSNDTISLLPERSEKTDSDNDTGLDFSGGSFAEIADGSAFQFDEDFTIAARIKTRHDGTLLSKTVAQPAWIRNGKTLFIRGGRLCYDIGWVGAVNSNREVADGKWHDIVMTWAKAESRVRFFVDGESAGDGELKPMEEEISDPVLRVGCTNQDFPAESSFNGQIEFIEFHQRRLTDQEIKDSTSRNESRLQGRWSSQNATQLIDESKAARHGQMVSGDAPQRNEKKGLWAAVTGSSESSDVVNREQRPKWLFTEDGNLRLVIPAGPAMELCISHAGIDDNRHLGKFDDEIKQRVRPAKLKPLTVGGPPSYPEVLESEVIRDPKPGAFAVDVLTRPTKNPWNCQLRLTGIDFLPDENAALLCAWDGSVWRVDGLSGDNKSSPLENQKIRWRRIAAGLFQPLGIKYINDKIYVSCRDQIVVLHDLNGDGETDWYENFNSDHQVTEHFHEFAMGLQTDADGNFYYAKSARHALEAIVPHHGTLLKVSADGMQTEILANGFRAANGVCLNPDGSFVVTDQEGHWNPKNRINWVKPGGFYGNMFGYHSVTDASDEAMDQPMCWITNSFDRSPSELLWVDSSKWGPLNHSLLNFSYGYGKVYIVPHESLRGQMQGGMCEFPIEQFPTGVMRGRFHPVDGQLYCCGMFAWAGTQQQPGGFYRIRYTGEPAYLPIGLAATKSGMRIEMSNALNPESVSDPENFAVQTWSLKRTKNYGSDHYDEQRIEVSGSRLQSDGKTIELDIPGIEPTWCMEIIGSVRSQDGKPVRFKIHNTIHSLGESNKLPPKE